MVHKVYCSEVSETPKSCHFDTLIAPSFQGGLVWLFHPLFHLCPPASAAQSRQSCFCSHHHHYHLLSIIHHPSWLGALGLDLKRGRGNLCCFRSDSHIQSQSLQSSSDDTTRKVEVLSMMILASLREKKEKEKRERKKKKKEKEKEKEKKKHTV